MKLGDVTTGLQQAGKKALVPFFTAGYPDEDTFVELVLAAAEAGCDAVEVGVPFSDPIADGPVIQASSQAALAAGMTLERALALAEKIAAQTATPQIAMSYVNPILNMGLERFVSRAPEAGIKGVILPDVSLEESAAFRGPLRGSGIDYIDLVAPTSGADRVRTIVTTSSGAGSFVYLVSVAGVTGTQLSPFDQLGAFTRRVREFTELPLYVGFGVSSPGDARDVVRHADGVIIGSQLIRLIREDPGDAVRAVSGFLAEVRRAIDTDSPSRPFGGTANS
jgi:tryptophan synthase alpha chain